MKRQDLYVVVGLVSDILYAYGFFLIVPALIGLFAAEYAQAVTFAAGAVVLVPVCWALRKKKPAVDIHIRHTAVALAVSWISLSLLSSVPFLVNGMSWVDALFESFSAWTDTGLTMIPHPEELPLSLSIFRILSQWISGIGIVILMLFLHGPSPQAARSLFQAEGRFEDFHTNIWHVGRTMVLIYASYTLVGFLLFVVLGVPPFHAFTHAVTSLSTGGFSTNSVGVGLYGALPSVVAMGLMLCGGISFSSHQAFLSGDVKKFLRNPEIRALFWLISGTTGLLLLQQALVRGQVVDRILPTLFHVISAVSTCGAGTTLPLSVLPDVSIFTIMFLMIVGAVYGSTTGGLKLWRIIIVARLIGREAARPFYPKGTVRPIRMGNNVISEETVLQVAAYVLLYLAVALVGSLIFMLSVETQSSGYRALYALFTVFSAQGNVGLNAMPDALYYGMQPILKLQLVFHMLIGRMEILPLFYLTRALCEPMLRARKGRG